MHVKSNYIIHENVVELDYKATSDTKNNPDICLPNFAKWGMQFCMFTWYIGLYTGFWYIYHFLRDTGNWYMDVGFVQLTMAPAKGNKRRQRFPPAEADTGVNTNTSTSAD